MALNLEGDLFASKKRFLVILPNGSSEMYLNMRTKYDSYIPMITPSEFGEWGMGKGDNCQEASMSKLTIHLKTGRHYSRKVPGVVSWLHAKSFLGEWNQEPVTRGGKVSNRTKGT